MALIVFMASRPPSGTPWTARAPLWFPSPLGDQPKVFDQLPYAGSGQGSGYNPLYPFAYGLSYTTFNVTGLPAPASVSRTGTVAAAFTRSHLDGERGPAGVSAGPPRTRAGRRPRRPGIAYFIGIFRRAMV